MPPLILLYVRNAFTFKDTKLVPSTFNLQSTLDKIASSSSSGRLIFEATGNTLDDISCLKQLFCITLDQSFDTTPYQYSAEFLESNVTSITDTTGFKLPFCPTVYTTNKDFAEIFTQHLSRKIMVLHIDALNSDIITHVYADEYDHLMKVMVLSTLGLPSSPSYLPTPSPLFSSLIPLQSYLFHRDRRLEVDNRYFFIFYLQATAVYSAKNALCKHDKTYFTFPFSNG